MRAHSGSSPSWRVRFRRRVRIREISDVRSGILDRSEPVPARASRPVPPVIKFQPTTAYPPPYQPLWRINRSAPPGDSLLPEIHPSLNFPRSHSTSTPPLTPTPTLLRHRRPHPAVRARGPLS